MEHSSPGLFRRGFRALSFGVLCVLWFCHAFLRFKAMLSIFDLAGTDHHLGGRRCKWPNQKGLHPGKMHSMSIPYRFHSQSKFWLNLNALLGINLILLFIHRLSRIFSMKKTNCLTRTLLMMWTSSILSNESSTLTRWKANFVWISNLANMT